MVLARPTGSEAVSSDDKSSLVALLAAAYPSAGTGMSSLPPIPLLRLVSPATQAAALRAVKKAASFVKPDSQYALFRTLIAAERAASRIFSRYDGSLAAAQATATARN